MRRFLVFLVLVVIVVGGGVAWRGRTPHTQASIPAVHVALGASDAVGIGATRPTTDGWAPLVTAGLPPGTQLVNLGVSGATLAGVLETQLPVAVDAAPRWVTIWPGPNDFRNGTTLALFTQQLDQVLTALRPSAVNQQRLIAVVTIPDLRALPTFASVDRAVLDARVREWNAAITAAVARHAPYAVLVDLYAGWNELAVHPEYISGDGFHPSSAGYRRLAELILETMRRHDTTLGR